MSNIIVGDNGTVLSVTVSDDEGAVDLATLSSISAHFVRADGTVFDKPLTVIDAVNGKCSVTLSAENVNVAGTYAFQVTAMFADGSIFSGDILKFKVGAKL